MKSRFINFLLFLLLFLLTHISLFAQSRPVATNLQAIAKSREAIHLSWDFDANDSIEHLLVFRSNKTISTSQDLLILKPLANLPNNARTFDDMLEQDSSEQDFYYAVIAQFKDGSTYNVVLPSINATVNKVQLLSPIQTQKLIDKEEKEEKLYMEGELREQPLPYLQKSLPDKDLKDSQSAAEKVKNMFPLSQKGQKKKLSPHIFREDTQDVRTGDDYLLQMILKRTFFVSDYKKAANELTQFLSVNREKEAVDRSYFYLGQCYYFSNDYQKALSYFLHTQNIYPELTRKWAKYTLDDYEIPQP